MGIGKGPFSGIPGLHRLNCSGLIDRDYRTEDAISLLNVKGVHVLPLSEEESLIRNEHVLTAVRNGYPTVKCTYTRTPESGSPTKKGCAADGDGASAFVTH